MYIKINGITYYGEEAERRSEQMVRDVLEPEPKLQPREELPPQKEDDE